MLWLVVGEKEKKPMSKCPKCDKEACMDELCNECCCTIPDSPPKPVQMGYSMSEQETEALHARLDEKMCRFTCRECGEVFWRGSRFCSTCSVARDDSVTLHSPPDVSNGAVRQPISQIVNQNPVCQPPPKPAPSDEEIKRLRRALDEIARLAEIRSDGAPDASPGDRACGVIRDIAEAVLGERRG